MTEASFVIHTGLWQIENVDWEGRVDGGDDLI
jgi:hypothetical protein